MKFYKLKINLLGEDRKISREILVPEDITFAYLHMNIQKAMGWENKHLYAFIVGNVLIESDDYTEPSQASDCMPTFTKISELVNVGDTFQYIYDMGDEWRHEIKVLDLIEVSVCEPIILKRKGKCPKEDSRH